MGDASLEPATKSIADASEELASQKQKVEHKSRVKREAGLAADAKQEVGGKIKRQTAIAEQASVEKGAKLDREGKRELSRTAGEDHTAEEHTEETEMRTEANAKFEREKKQRDKKFAERNAKAEADMFKDAAGHFGDGAEAAAKERERMRKIAKAERQKKAGIEADRKKAAAEASKKAAAEEEKAAKAADKAREASLAAKVEHIKKLRAEHKKKAGHEFAELDKSKKEEEKKEETERLDIWGSKLGAAGAAVRKTVDVQLDDAAAEAKAEEEEKVHSVKMNERDGKTKREAALVKEAGTERTTKTDREHRIEVEEKKLRADQQEMSRKEA